MEECDGEGELEVYGNDERLIEGIGRDYGYVYDLIVYGWFGGEY